MTLTFTLPCLFLFISIVLGIIVSLVCWIYPGNARSSVQFLGASIFSLTVASIILVSFESGLILCIPHFMHTNFIATLFIMPFSYLFVRGMTDQQKLSTKDLVHLLPVLFFLLDYYPVYAMSGAEKLHMLQQTSFSAYDFAQGWLLPPVLHKVLRVTIFFCYFSAQWRLIHFSKITERKWLVGYMAAQLFLWMSYIMNQLLGSDHTTGVVLNAVVSLYLGITTVSLLFHPNILYGLSSQGSGDDPQPGEETVNDAQALVTLKADYISGRLVNLMTDKLPFLQHRYSILDLSADLQIPSYQLSSFLNHHVGLSFHDYLNKHRIQYCVDRIRAGGLRSLTLEALAYDCGFNNRNSFTTAFKRFIGCTPSEFVRSQRKTA